MAGTTAGGLKTRAKNLLKDPDFYVKLGSLGGAAKVRKGFACDSTRARVAGAKGGRISKRGRALYCKLGHSMEDAYVYASQRACRPCMQRRQKIYYQRRIAS